jgi:hypothetical protein
LEKSVFRLLNRDRTAHFQPTEALAAGLARAMTEVNQDFLETKLPLVAFIDVSSTHDDIKERVRGSVWKPMFVSAFLLTI